MSLEKEFNRIVKKRQQEKAKPKKSSQRYFRVSVLVPEQLLQNNLNNNKGKFSGEELAKDVLKGKLILKEFQKRLTDDVCSFIIEDPSDKDRI